MVLGTSLDVALDVETCTRDLGAQPDGEIPSEQVTVRATGERDDGVPVVLDLRRFRSQGAAATITDTVTVLEGTEAAPAGCSRPNGSRSTASSPTRVTPTPTTRCCG